MLMFLRSRLFLMQHLSPAAHQILFSSSSQSHKLGDEMDSDYKNGDRWVKKGLILGAVIFGFFLYLTPTSYTSVLHILGMGYCLNGLSYENRRNLRMLFRDIRAFFKLLRIHIFLKSMAKNNDTIPKAFQRTVQAHSDKVMFYFEEQSWTYKQVDEFSNQIGNFFVTHGVKENDIVALFMETRIEYTAIWLGLQKIGAQVSLINHNLTGEQLSYSLSSLANKLVIYGPEVERALEDILDTKNSMTLYCYADKDQTISIKTAVNLKEELKMVSTSTPKLPSTGNLDTALYVFTSGTTGMPKAVVLSHGRVISMTMALNKYLQLRQDDILYVCLPLYHTNGTTLGVGQAVFAGLTVALRKKFSVNSFWKDCIKYDCTAFIYIGEICRYLLAAEPAESDLQHKIRLMFGNGLRSNIWERFVRRFGIKKVAELYGSTEGIGPLTNTEGVIGAVGHVPLIWKNLFPVYLVKIDPDTEIPARDCNGRCILVTKPNEPGMHISKIIKENIGQDFKGYSDKSATNKKIIEDVFMEGDRYYVSGDIFTFDKELFLFFQDRTGDTFRWRGENVSTTEVEQIIMDIVGLKDAAVYGVEIPGEEGKAGMAAIACQPSEKVLEELHTGLTKKLVKYARPLFLRFLESIEITSTFKIKKKLLKEEGYNPNSVTDKLYYFNAKEKKYLVLSDQAYKDICSGNIRF